MGTTLVRTRHIAGCSVRCRGPKGREQLSLNDLWRAAGSPPNKDPRQWLRLPDARNFIAFEAKRDNVDRSHIIQSERGRMGGTWAAWIVALKYLGYLDKRLEDEAYRAWRQLQREEHDPDLAADMALRRVTNYYFRRGYSAADAERLAVTRLISKVGRNQLTDEWRGRGAQTCDLPGLTNAGYQGQLGATAVEIRQKRGWPKRANLRDRMDLGELSQTVALENWVREILRERDVRDVEQMKMISQAVGHRVREVAAEIHSATFTAKERP
jgi:hypothetical protein